jgi:hypothetical protein
MLDRASGVWTWSSALMECQTDDEIDKTMYLDQFQKGLSVEIRKKEVQE